MRSQGTVVRWDDARGFGFIRSSKGGQEVFFHVKDFRAASGQPPRLGLEVAFEQVHVGGKGPRATGVHPLEEEAGCRPATAPRSEPGRSRSRTAPAPTSSGAWLFLPLMVAYAATLFWAVSERKLPWWVLAASLLINLIAFFAYWQDKYAAEKRQWRTSEKTLHIWSLAGGWGGAWFAQQATRHKTVKASFRKTYLLTVVAHCGALGYWLYRGGL
jgi:uncharacterized membrane protein YsdA (DUF1294 family)/cold shock CspA family protein